MRLEQLITPSEDVAIIYDGIKISYQELIERADKMAAFILENPLDKKMIGIQMEHSPGAIISLLAALKAGCGYIYIPPNTPEARLEYIKKTLGLDAVFTSLKSSNKKITPCDLNSVAYSFATSGTTGDPKLLSFSHKAAYSFIQWTKELLPLLRPKVVGISSLSFDLSVLDIFYTLSSKGTLIIPTPQEKLFPKLTLELINKHQADLIYTTPSRLNLLGKQIRSSSLSHIIFAGEPFESSQFLKIYDKAKHYFNFYGPTETNVCFYKKIIDPQIISLGQACPYVQYKIEKDILFIKGESLFEGAPEWYNTGDLVQIKNEEIFFNGRVDHQIKKQGYRINMLEIENFLKSIEGINQSKAIFKNNLLTIEYSGEKKDIEKIILSKFPSYYKPDQIIFKKNLPLSSHDKI